MPQVSKLISLEVFRIFCQHVFQCPCINSAVVFRGDDRCVLVGFGLESDLRRLAASRKRSESFSLRIQLSQNAYSLSFGMSVLFVLSHQDSYPQLLSTWSSSSFYHIDMADLSPQGVNSLDPWPKSISHPHVDCKKKHRKIR